MKSGFICDFFENIHLGEMVSGGSVGLFLLFDKLSFFPLAIKA